MIVMKFGGTSTQDAASISNVAKIILSRLKQQPVVVISAIAQATNVLERAGTIAAEQKEEEALNSIRALIERHQTIVDSLISDKGRRKTVTEFIQSAHIELETLIHGIGILKELTPRTLDSLYCFGELLSSRIVATVLQEHNVDAEWVDTKEFMITDGNHNCAQPIFKLVEERLPEMLRPLLNRGSVPVTQGFIGVTQSGRRTTMGRESSDYSASIIGCLLKADDIQIWTDVDGVLTADPRIVANPKKVKVLTFEEAYELSYFGAKVLHPSTMLPAVERNIPIHIFNSRRPQLSGTLVANQSPDDRKFLKSVAFKRNVSLITVSPKARYSPYIFWEHIQSVLTKFNASANLTSTSEYNYSFLLDTKNEISAICHDLSEVGKVECIPSRAVVSLVGSNLRGSPDLLGRLFSAIGKTGVSMISFGASTSSFSFVIEDAAVVEIVKRIHSEFFEREADEAIFESLDIPNNSC
jgi:aspartate kinase